MKGIFCLFVIFLIPLTPVYGYYTDTLPWHMNGAAPIICIWESDHDVLFAEAIHIWWKALVEKYGKKQGGFPAYMVNGSTSGVEECTINIIYVDNDVGTPEDGMRGITHLLQKGKSFWIFIFEGSRSDNEELYNLSIVRTTLHEMGHAFGLGHWLPESAGEALRPWPLTLMWQYGDLGYPAEIDEFALLQFDCIYHSDGWLGKNTGCATLRLGFGELGPTEFKR